VLGKEEIGNYYIPFKKYLALVECKMFLEYLDIGEI
jgi:hypothetical protein